jgi:hypothetical protein
MRGTSLCRQRLVALLNKSGWHGVEDNRRSGWKPICVARGLPSLVGGTVGALRVRRCGCVDCCVVEKKDRGVRSCGPGLPSKPTTRRDKWCFGIRTVLHCSGGWHRVAPRTELLPRVAAPLSGATPPNCCSTGLLSDKRYSGWHPV